jgi:hypothetical protein
VGSISTTFCARTSSAVTLGKSRRGALRYLLYQQSQQSAVLVFVGRFRQKPTKFRYVCPMDTLSLHGMHQDTKVQCLRAPFVGACLSKTGHQRQTDPSISAAHASASSRFTNSHNDTSRKSQAEHLNGHSCNGRMLPSRWPSRSSGSGARR